MTSIFFSVANLPKVMEWGPQMTPTSSGDNVLLTYERAIYTLSFKEASYEWKKKGNKLSISREMHVQFLVPASLPIILDEKEEIEES